MPLPFMSDRMKGPLLRLIQSADPRADYRAPYRAKVVAQSSDLRKVDVDPDDTRLPNMSKVPIRLGVPGITVQFSSGAFVMIQFFGGDPRYPYATAWEGGETDQVLNLAGSVGGLVRVGDTLTTSSQLATWAGQVEAAVSGLGGVVPSPAFSVGVAASGHLGTAATGSSIVKAG